MASTFSLSKSRWVLHRTVCLLVFDSLQSLLLLTATDSLIPRHYYGSHSSFVQCPHDIHICNVLVPIPSRLCQEALQYTFPFVLSNISQILQLFLLAASKIMKFSHMLPRLHTYFTSMLSFHLHWLPPDIHSSIKFQMHCLLFL